MNGDVGVTYKPVSGFPGYWVGDDGSVWCDIAFGPGGGPGKAKWRRRKLTRRKDGYIWVSLHRDGRTVGVGVHRLVLTAFVGQPPAGHVGCHNNGLRHDNRLCNLRWDTHAANIADMKRHGTMNRPQGEKSPSAKLSDMDVSAIRRLRECGVTFEVIAQAYRIHVVYARQLVRGLKRSDYTRTPLPDGTFELDTPYRKV